MSDITISHVTTAHPVTDARIFFREVLSLHKAGFKVKLIAGGAKSEIAHGIEIIGVDAPLSPRWKRFLYMGKAVYQRALEADADVYHFHDPDFLKYAKKLVKQGKVVIYDVHEDVPRQMLSKAYLPMPLRRILSVIFEKWENHVARQLSGIITATSHIEDRYRKLNSKVVAVRNYPSLDDMGEPAPFAQKEKVCCYIGGITKVRGIQEMVDALAFAPYPLELAGTFDSAETKVRAEQSAGWKNVVEHGFVDRNGVRQILAKSRVGLVLLHPIINYLDALPVKLFEYMAAGIPVVISDVPLWQSIVDQAQCGICVDPFDNEAVGAAIDRLMNDDQTAREMGENGRKWVLEQYNWETQAKLMIAFYRQHIIPAIR